MSRRGRRAFTLVELLVVIGIIALLVTILLPVMHKARIASQRTVCAARLRELTAACTMYLGEYKVYPPPGVLAEQSAVIPHILPVRILNQLAPYLRYQMIDPTLPTLQFPQITLCPFRQELEFDPLGSQMALANGPCALTGFQYTAGLEAPENSDGMILKPQRATDARGKHRGGIWSDALGWYAGSGLVFLPPGAPPSWAYFHIAGNTHYNGMGPGDLAAFGGQHRAWSDGSVEWIGPTMIDPDPSHRDQTASYRAGKTNAYVYYWF